MASTVDKNRLFDNDAGGGGNGLWGALQKEAVTNYQQSENGVNASESTREARLRRREEERRRMQQGGHQNANSMSGGSANTALNGNLPSSIMTAANGNLPPSIMNAKAHVQFEQQSVTNNMNAISLDNQRQPNVASPNMASNNFVQQPTTMLPAKYEHNITNVSNSNINPVDIAENNRHQSQASPPRIEREAFLPNQNQQDILYSNVPQQAMNRQDQQREYAMELERQIAEKEARERQERAQPAPAVTYHTAPLRDNRQTKQQEYAMELERQIAQKEALERQTQQQQQYGTSAAPVYQNQMNASNKYSKQQEYAMELDRQMADKAAREKQTQMDENRNANNHQNFQSQQENRYSKQQEYAMELERQIAEKQALEQNQKYSSQSSGFYPGNNSQNNSKYSKQQEYAMELQRQIQEKEILDRESQGHQQRPEQNGRDIAQSAQKQMKQQAYAMELQRQIAEKQQKERLEKFQTTGRAPPPASSSSSFMGANSYDPQRQYAMNVERKMMEKNSNSNSAWAQQQQMPQSHYGNSPNATYPPGSYGFQNQPYPSMQPVQLYNAPNNAYDRGQPMQGYQVQAVPPFPVQRGPPARSAYDSSQISFGGPEPTRQPMMVNQSYAPPPMQNFPVNNGYPQPLGSPGYMDTGGGYGGQYPQQLVIPSGNQAYPPQDGMAMSPTMYGTNSAHPRNPESGFVKFKSDIRDSSTMEELEVKKMKQNEQRNKLMEQMEADQRRKQQEKQMKRAEEMEEEMRLERERAELQKAFEEEQNQKKKGETYQAELQKQIEEKKRQKELERQKEQDEARAEEMRLQRERAELQSKFANEHGGDNDRRGASVEQLKADMFGSPQQDREPNPFANSSPGNRNSRSIPESQQPQVNSEPSPNRDRRQRRGSRRQHVAMQDLYAEEPDDGTLANYMQQEGQIVQKIVQKAQDQHMEHLKTKLELEKMKLKIQHLEGNNAERLLDQRVSYSFPDSLSAARSQHTNVMGSYGGAAPKYLDGPSSPTMMRSLPPEPPMEPVRRTTPRRGYYESSNSPNSPGDNESLMGTLNAQSTLIFPKGASHGPLAQVGRRAMESPRTVIPPNEDMKRVSPRTPPAEIRHPGRSTQPAADSAPPATAFVHGPPPEFDIQRISMKNRNRLEYLNKLTDSGPLQGDQLDEFLGDFLTQSKQPNSGQHHPNREYDLQSEQRWLRINQ